MSGAPAGARPRTFGQVSRLGLELLSRLINVWRARSSVFQGDIDLFKMYFVFCLVFFRHMSSRKAFLASIKFQKRKFTIFTYISALARSHPCFRLRWWIPRWRKMRIRDFRRYWPRYRSHESLNRSDSRSMGHHRIRGKSASS